MKTITKILVALGVTLFLLTVGMKSEAEATCPLGYSTKTINMNVGGCIYQFDICYKCSPLGAGATKIQLGSWPTLITPGCIPTVPFNAVVDYILSQIQTPAFLFSEVCVFNPVPPCDGPPPPYIVTFNLPQCWQAEVIHYFGENTLYFSSCSDDYCETSYTICKDSGGNYIKTLLPPAIGSSTPECHLIEPIFDFPTLSDPVGTKTPCYIYHTPCDSN